MMGVLRRWLSRHQNSEVAPSSSDMNRTRLLADSSMNRRGVFFITQIENGFLLIEHAHNPSGPDILKTTYAADPDDMHKKLVALFAMRKLT